MEEAGPRARLFHVGCTRLNVAGACGATLTVSYARTGQGGGAMQRKARIPDPQQE
jgi:hypothetical protein